MTRAYNRGASKSFPTSCKGSVLPTAGTGVKSYISGMDSTGSYVSGRLYGGDPVPVLWHQGKATMVPLGGVDDGLEDVNSHGDAVGYAYLDAPKPYAYVGGKVYALAGGAAEASGINDSGVMVGSLDRRTPLLWRSATAEPTRLPLPSGFSSAQAIDIDADGTVVGSNGAPGGRTGIVWYPDGSVHVLPTPTLDGVEVVDHDPRRISNGWVTGYAVHPTLREVGVRWDLATGKAEVLPGLESSRGINALGWVVGMDRNRDAVVTDGVRTLALSPVFAKPKIRMNWGDAISDDGRSIAGVNDDKAHDGEQRGVLWRCQ